MRLIKISIFFLAIMFFAVNASAQMVAAKKVVNQMTLTGNIKGAGNVDITLERLDGVKYGTTKAKKGKFEIKSTGSLPYPFKLTVGDKVMFAALESGNISIVGNIDDLQNAEVKDPSSHKEYMVLLRMLAKCADDDAKDMAMETFMSKHSHSWISMYCLTELNKKYGDNAPRMRYLLEYVKHFRGSDTFDKIENGLKD